MSVLGLTREEWEAVLETADIGYEASRREMSREDRGRLMDALNDLEVAVKEAFDAS